MNSCIKYKATPTGHLDTFVLKVAPLLILKGTDDGVFSEKQFISEAGSASVLKLKRVRGISNHFGPIERANLSYWIQLLN